MGDLGTIFLLSLVAMFNPTLLAAVTVMLLLPNPKKLMLGYLLGAYLTSISLGLVIVFSLNDSSGVDTAKNTLSPSGDIVVGLIALVVAFVLRTGRDAKLRERRRRKRAGADEGKEWPERMLGRGSARITFAVGVVLTLPGVAYLTALNHMAKLDAGTVPTALLVIGFCLVQQLLLELPLLGYAFAPEWTRDAVARFRAWLARSGRGVATTGAAVIGVLLLIRGAAGLVG